MRMRIAQLSRCIIPVLVLGACAHNPMDAPASVGPPYVLYASHLQYPAQNGEVRDSSEFEFPMTGMPSPREAQRLLTLAGTNRVEWVYFCNFGISRDPRAVPGCRIVGVYPDSPAIRAEVSRLSARIRYIAPASRHDQQPETFSIDIRVAMSRGSVPYNEPCVISLCGFVHRPMHTPPQPSPPAEQQPG